MKMDAMGRLQRDARRVAEILGVLARYGLADWLQGVPVSWLQEHLRTPEGEPMAGMPAARRLRMALAELGPTFIKAGQILSTRADLIGPEWADELAELQSRAPADDAGAVRKLVEEELGRPMGELFASFADTPLASASIAQVHAATLHGGEDVVVKVQHAGIRGRIEADLEILGALAEVAERYSERLRPFQPTSLVRHFRRQLLRELDFEHERASIDEFAGNFAGDATVRFPRTWRELTTRRVLVMERLRGIPGTDRAGLEASGADLAGFARSGATVFLGMIFRDSFYHADPHPGNLMLLEGGVVGIIDCGMTGRLDEVTRDEVERLLFAAAGRDVGELTELVLRLGSAPAGIDRDRLRAELDDFVGEHVGRSLQDLDLSGALNALGGVIRRFQITLPPSVALLLRTLVVLEGTSRQLNPAFSLAELVRPFYVRSVRRRWSPTRVARRMARSYRDWERLLGTLPRDLSDVLDRVRAGTFNVHLDHRHLDPVVNRLVLGVVTAAMLVSSSLLWAMKAPPVWHDVPVVGALGYGVGLYLAWRLFRAVRRSGNIDSKD